MNWELLQLSQGSQDDFGQSGDAGDPSAGSIVDSVQDCGVRSIQRSLAAAGSTVRTIGTVGLQIMQLDVIGNILGIRNTAVLQAGVLGEVLEVLGKSQADALCQLLIPVFDMAKPRNSWI